MTVDYAQWSEQVKRLHRALEALAPRATKVGVARPEGEDWFELLERKLLKEIDAAPFLVVAVVGGTNIGKSLLFNHLAGENASAVSRLAAGTKHPVCAAPANFADAELLAARFEGFQVIPWTEPADALLESEEHRLYWRAGPNVPERLLLLDTPDIDSDAQVNWRRADHVREAADVLVAVLTQQKYNDAAVKKFFRKAAESDKQVVVVFNQCDLEADRDYWPQWLETFTSETGVDPELVYVVPYDRAAADSLQLPFYVVGRDGGTVQAVAGSLRDELAALHFDEIKIRTFRGALAKLLDPAHGAEGYLRHIDDASQQFVDAARGLTREELARVDWPNLPTALLLEEIGRWWAPRRNPLARGVHGFYRRVTDVVTLPVRAGWRAVAGPGEDPLAAFRAREREAIVRAVGRFLDDLDRLSKAGNEVLRSRLSALLRGRERAELLARIQQAYDELPALGEDYRDFVAAELDQWAEKNPRAVQFLRSLDNMAAAGRPVITVGLVISGAAWTGADHALAQAAGGAITELVKDTVVTTTVAGGGEAMVSAAGESVKQAGARLFARLQRGHARLRGAWLAAWLDRELLGELMAELRAGAEAAQSAEFREVRAALTALSTAGDAARA